jgi:predicted ribosomally synthesized peptide with SipW-like signal peptide
VADPGTTATAERSEETKAAPASAPPSRFTKSAVRLAATLVMMVLLGVGAGVGTWSAFSSTTDNTGNSFQAGTVVLTDNDSGTSMLSLANAKPGDADVSCINVSYTGTLASSVRLYGTTTGTGLDQYMDLVVTRGTGAAGFNDCTGFTPDAANHIGAGSGVVYSGTLQGFGDNYAAAVVDPTAGSPEVWTTGESHVYRFSVTVQDNNAAQGLNATQSFTWEARNN